MILVFDVCLVVVCLVCFIFCISWVEFFINGLYIVIILSIVVFSSCIKVLKLIDI